MQTIDFPFDAARNNAMLTAKVRNLIAVTTVELQRMDAGMDYATPSRRSYVERELKAYYEWLAA